MVASSADAPPGGPGRGGSWRPAVASKAPTPQPRAPDDDQLAARGPVAATRSKARSSGRVVLAGRSTVPRASTYRPPPTAPDPPAIGRGAQGVHRGGPGPTAAPSRGRPPSATARVGVTTWAPRPTARSISPGYCRVSDGAELGKRQAVRSWTRATRAACRVGGHHEVEPEDDVDRVRSTLRCGGQSTRRHAWRRGWAAIGPADHRRRRRPARRPAPARRRGPASSPSTPPSTRGRPAGAAAARRRPGCRCGCRGGW